MENIGSSRRDLLKFSPLALAAVAAPAAFAAPKPAPQAQPRPSSSTSAPTAPPATAKPSTPPPSTKPSKPQPQPAAAPSSSPPAPISASPSISRATSISTSSQGATILAADSPKPGETTGYNGGTYDAPNPTTAWDAYQDYGHNHWHNSLIWGEDLHDISITGPGLIYGKGLSFGSKGTRGDYPIYIAEQPGVGNKSIALKNCRNVLLRDFSILKGGHFGLLLTGVDNLTIDNLTIDTDRDGMDIDCCQNVRVSNCTVNSPWDDGICPKSSYALGYARPTRNVTITNCYVTGCYQLGTVLDGTFKKFARRQRAPYGTGRIKCGTESNGGFINITISNCVFEGCLGYALETVDGALLEDIAITNTTMRDSAPARSSCVSARASAAPKTTTQSVGTLKRVLISQPRLLQRARAASASILSGIPGYPIEDVKLSNIYVETTWRRNSRAGQASQVPEQIDGYPEPGHVRRHALLADSSCATSATSR